MKPIRNNRLATILPAADGLAVAAAGSSTVEWLAYPPGGSSMTPAQTGLALAQTLRACGLRASAPVRAVLPDDWVTFKRLDLPRPDDETLLDGMVELALERTFAETREQLAIGWAVSASWSKTDGEVAVSVAACGRQRLERLEELCRAADLRLVAVVPLAASLAAATDGPGALLLRDGDSIALSLFDGGIVVDSRRFGASDQERASGLARAALAFAAAEIQPTELLYLGDGPTAGQAAEALGISTTRPLPAAPQEAERPAVSQLSAQLAARPRAGQTVANLLDGPARRSRRSGGRLVRRLAIAAGVLLAAIVAAGWNWHALRSDIADLQARAEAIAPEMAVVNHSRRMTELTDACFDRRAFYLDALTALTEQFPAEGTIWVSELQVDRAGEISMTGRAYDRAIVLELFKRIQLSGAFRRLTIRYIRDLSGARRGVSFAAACGYGKEVAP